MVSLSAAAVALAVRFGLATTGVGRHLAWRPEIGTAANSNLELREGLALARLGASPYSGSAVRVPPLALWLHGPLADHDLLYALPNALLDLLAASLLQQLALHLLKRSSRGSCALASALSWTYLLNPLLLLPSVAGTTSPLEGLAVLAALHGSCSGRPLLAAVGLALAAYLSPHAGLLALAAAYLLTHGAEELGPPAWLAPGAAQAGGAQRQQEQEQGQGVDAGGGAEPVQRGRRTPPSSAAKGGRAGAGGGGQEAGPSPSTPDASKGRSEAAGAAAAAAAATPPREQQQQHSPQAAPGGGAGGDGQPVRRGRRKGPEGDAGSDTEPPRRGRRTPPPTATQAGEAAAGDAAEEPGPPLGAPGGAATGAARAAAARPAAAPAARRQDSGAQGGPAAPLLPWRMLVRLKTYIGCWLLLLVLLSDLYLVSLQSPYPRAAAAAAADTGSGTATAAPGGPCLTSAVQHLLLQPPWPSLAELLAPPIPPELQEELRAQQQRCRVGGRCPPPPALPQLPLQQRLALAAQRVGRQLASRAQVTRGSLAGCWAVHVYGPQLLLDDVTPNIGQWWYLAMEGFEDSMPYIRILAHSLLLALALPLGLRLGRRRPLALFLLQLTALAALKPYPSVADLGLATCLLLLLWHQQLQLLRLPLLLPASLLLLCVLGPAMLRMWLAYESANSNFYYSITLLLGLWQALLLGQVLALTLQVDRLARGKEPPPALDVA